MVGGVPYSFLILTNCRMVEVMVDDRFWLLFMKLTAEEKEKVVRVAERFTASRERVKSQEPEPQ